MKKKILIFSILILGVSWAKVFPAAIDEFEVKLEVLDELVGSINKISDIKDESVLSIVKRLMLLTEDRLERVFEKVSVSADLKIKLKELIHEESLKLDQQCSICWARLIPAQKIYYKNQAFECNHLYHRACLNQWFAANPDKLNCPYCQVKTILGRTLNTENLLLLRAIKNGRQDEIQALIDRGVCLDYRDANGNTPLIYPVRAKKIDTVRLLIQNGADIDYVNKLDQNAFSIAIMDPHRHEIAKLLVSLGANVNRVNRFGDTPIIQASSLGLYESVSLLIDLGANINQRDKYGRTSLMIAAKYDNISIVNLLISYAANINSKSKDGKTALLHATYHGNESVAKLLIANGADINCSDIHGNTPLMCASGYGYSWLVKLFIESGANINQENIEGETALTLAKREGHERITDFLDLMGGVDPKTSFLYFLSTLG